MFSGGSVRSGSSRRKARFIHLTQLPPGLYSVCPVFSDIFKIRELFQVFEVLMIYEWHKNFN